HLAASLRPANQDQPGDVRAAENQDQAADDQQQSETDANRREYLAARLPVRAGLEHERSRAERLALRVVDLEQQTRIDVRQDRAIQRIQAGGGRVERHARLEPPEEMDPVEVATVVIRDLESSPARSGVVRE